uniref:Uncharacterized protein n=1 Tax=Panagrellus redivivus TaxID=6233 RepID=A0A7E4VGF8_PANRE
MKLPVERKSAIQLENHAGNDITSDCGASTDHPGLVPSPFHPSTLPSCSSEGVEERYSCGYLIHRRSPSVKLLNGSLPLRIEQPTPPISHWLYWLVSVMTVSMVHPHRQACTNPRCCRTEVTTWNRRRRLLKRHLAPLQGLIDSQLRRSRHLSSFGMLNASAVLSSDTREIDRSVVKKMTETFDEIRESSISATQAPSESIMANIRAVFGTL